MKKSLLAALTALLIAALAGCASAPKDLDIGKLAQTLNESIAFDEELTATDFENGRKLYQITADEAVQGVIYVGTGATVDELSVWQARDAKSAQTIKEKIEARVAYQKDSYEDYKPAEIPKLTHPIILVKGDYVLFCVVGDSDGAKQWIDREFK